MGTEDTSVVSVYGHAKAVATRSMAVWLNLVSFEDEDFMSQLTTESIVRLYINDNRLGGNEYLRPILEKLGWILVGNFNCQNVLDDLQKVSKDVKDVVLLDSKVKLSSEVISELTSKRQEYGDSHILTTSGGRIFPYIPVQSPTSFYHDFMKIYNVAAEDRAVHLYQSTGNIVIIPSKLYVVLHGYSSPEVPPRPSEGDLLDIWNSFIASRQLSVPIWKIKLTSLGPFVQTNAKPIRDDCSAYIMDIIKKLNWPVGILQPLLPFQTRAVADLWGEGFGGLNMDSEGNKLDFLSAKSYGVNVIRIGAVRDAKDLTYLVDDKSNESAEDDLITLKMKIERLRFAIAEAASSGLKVIITLTDLPGRSFKDTTDHRCWNNPSYANRIAKLWGALAKLLKDLRTFIAGYDLINEPFTPVDVESSSNDLLTDDHNDIYSTYLTELYNKICSEIRKYDQETAIIIESQFWASPLTIPLLTPIDDVNVVYSFHFYEPKLYTNRRNNQGELKYPGLIPLWKNATSKYCKEFWDRDNILNYVSPVRQWQKKYEIPSSRVMVGEFGVCRDVEGAAQYLLDVISVFKECGWSWCLFSFRDNEWDAMDYELGTNSENHLYRHKSDLMMAIAEHFY